MGIFLCQILPNPKQPAPQFEHVSFSYDGISQLIQHEKNGECFGVLFGRIFNLDELAKAAGIGLQLSDLGKLVELKWKYQERLASLLRGDFFLAFIHLGSLEVELTRSPFSSKECCYFWDDSGFYFSNSLPYLKRNIPSQTDIDPERLVDAFSRDYRLFEHSFYKKIFHLGNGQILQWSPCQTIKKRIFWKADDHHSVSSEKFSSYTEGLKVCLETAVKNRLMGDDKACCFISGGLDSTSVAGVLAQSTSSLVGLSDFSTTDCELKLLKSVTNAHFLSDFEAMYPNTQIFHHDGLSFSKNYSEITRFCFNHTGGPEHAPGNLVWFLPFSEFVHHQGFNKIFGGSMGDAAFSFRVELPQKAVLSLIRLFASRVKRAIIFQDKRENMSLLQKKWQGSLPSNRIGASWALKNPNQKRIEFLNVLLEYMTAASRFFSGVFNQFGLEYVDPTCDLDLIEYCLTIPAEAYQKNGVNRYVTREAMKGIIPESIRLNQVKGAQGMHWYLPLRRELEHYKSLLPRFGKNNLIAELVDLPRLKRLLHEFEYLPVRKLTSEHRNRLVHALHICEWVILHES